MATIIDTLLVSLKLDGASFKRDADTATKANDRLSDSLGGATEESEKFAKSINNGVKALTGLFSAILVSSGLQKLIDDTAKVNDQLNFLSKNLGMSAASVKQWQGAAALSGGSAEGMASSLSGLSKSLWDLVTMGDTSVLPYFNALNVGVVKSNGELRDLDDILLDVSDSLSKMSRPQAYNLAKNMGFDDGTINMLLQGRKEIERQLALQKQIYTSSEQELALSRKLNESNSLIGRQWEGLKTLIGNYLMPYFVAFSDVVNGFFGYLNQNKDTAISLFKGIATIIGITLIPIALKAGVAFLAMFAPLFSGVGLIAMLGAGLLLLLDDYNAWKEGSGSLIDWGKWEPGIKKAVDAFDLLWKKLKDLGSVVSETFTSMLKLISIDTSKFSGKWLFDQIIGSATAAIKTLGHFVDVIRKIIDGDFTGAWSSMVEFGKEAAASPLAQGAKAVGAGIYNKLNDGINSILPEFLGGTPKASGVRVPKTNQRIYQTDTGDIMKENGSRAWRNNNPGNIEFGDLARRFGAIGSDGRFAIFPTEEMGAKAKNHLLFESNRAKNLSTKGDYGAGLGYKDKTLSQAIRAYAPQEENQTEAYIAQVLASVGGADKRMGDYSSDERETILRAFKKVEGWKVGREYALNQGGFGVGDLIASINKPIVDVDMSQASNFIGQSDRLKSQGQTVNNRVEANFGDININTTASTISGNITDATQAAEKQVYQLVHAIS